MRVWTQAVYHWDDATQNYVLAEDESSSFSYEGPIASCKATQEEKDLQAQQAAFYKTQTQWAEQQYGKQSAITDAITKAWKPIMDAGADQYGYTAAEDTALRTQATEGTAAEYKKAQQAVQQSMSSRGGGNELLPSGVDDQIYGSLAASAASDQASKNLDITNKGYDLGYNKFLAASNALNGNANTLNPLGYTTAATNAGSSAFDMASTIQQQDSAWQGMLGGLAGSLGDAAITGGFSLAGAGKKGGSCWIAAALYDGWDDPRTIVTREWLNTEFIKSHIGRFVMGLYAKYGERTAEFLKKHTWAKSPFRPIFRIALRKAQNWKATVAQ
jgi:hypothetical protein